MGESVLVGSVCHERGLCALLHCQDDIEAFHPSVFDSCGGQHGGFV